jgi:hypothetical protein
LDKKIVGLTLIAITAIALTAILIYYMSIQSTPSPSVPTEPDSVTKPAVPEFTVELVDEGYQINLRTVIVKITNQPFEPYTDSDGRKIDFYYNIRLKGHNKENWTEVYNAGEMPTQSNSAYTIIEYNSEGNYTFILGPTSNSLEVTPNGQVDFQVEAMIGHTYEESAGLRSWAFVGERSGWSEAQTITIP